MPRWIYTALASAVIVSLIPLACVARKRATLSPLPRVHLVQDMDNQPRFKGQAPNPLFADGRAMRPPVAGTVARGELRDDEHAERGRVDGAWATSLAPAVIEEYDGDWKALLGRGRDRYGVFCAPCHGLSGEGDGMVARRAERLQEGTWVPPSSLHTETVRGRPDGHLYNTIANGIRTMPAYGSQVEVSDRWAIVAYVRALQRSRHAGIDDVPPEELARLGAE